MQIQREGRVTFGEARLAIWEEGIPREWKAKVDWDRKFKHDVFKRIIQTLNRIGWTVGEQTHIFVGNNSRHCVKGSLQADLKICGHSIELEFFQSVNTPDRADHGGRYQSDKERLMPYLVSLEMERTRRRIRDYLCNVFTGYVFQEPDRKCGLNGMTSVEWINADYVSKRRFCPPTIPPADYNSGSGDKKTIVHGAKVWTTDRKGRWIQGTAFVNINNMWWVAYGKYGFTNKACFEIFVDRPEDVYAKSNERRRRQRLEDLLARAVAGMNYQRADVLRKVLFPNPEPLFMIFNVKDELYFRPNYSGYTKDTVRAGKYTRAELKPYLGDADQKDDLKAVPISQAA
jgi:hypothetical protein